MRKFKVVVVDDSAFMRKSLAILLESDTEIEIVGSARDGIEAIDIIKKTRPDVVTLDVEMPRMDGLTALKKIMKECPTSVIMVSSLTTDGAEATLKALELGAVDFISKEMSFVSVKIANIKDELIHKIKTIAKQDSLKNRLLRIQKSLRKGSSTVNQPVVHYKHSLPKYMYKAIALGISTGGPLSLQKVIPLIDKRLKVPMFIVQHMPPNFTKSLSDRLNNMSGVKVKEAENNEIAENGTIYIAPGGMHMKVFKNGMPQIQIKISEQPDTTLHKPSVDVMMESVIDVFGKGTLGVIMTGMGKDGLEGIRKLKDLGGYAMAQDEDSCVVYGMPKAIVDAGFADAVVPLEKIASTINSVL